MSNIKIVSDDDEFNGLLKAAGDDLVVIDFFTTWCGPCRAMEPVCEQMSIRYPKVTFLKVDADKCFNTAMNYKVSKVPFFVIYFNKTVVETVQGANTQELELKIRLAVIESRKATSPLEAAGLVPTVNPVTSTYGKLGAITQYIDFEKSSCINDLSPTSFHNFLGGKKLISGKGSGKVLLLYIFTQRIMLQSFKIKANPQAGPKVLRFFVNHPKVLDFNVGSTLAPSQEVTLNPHDLTGERAIELRSGSFQVVTNVQIFVTSGQTKNSRIEIESLQLFGAPVLGTQTLGSAPDPILAPTPPAVPDEECPNKSPSADLDREQGNAPSTSATATPSAAIPEPRQLAAEQLPGHSRNLIEAHHNLNNQEQQHHHSMKKGHHHHHQHHRH